MEPRKLKVIDEILSHLSDSQAMQLKSLLEKTKSEVPTDLPEKPKGIAIEKVEVLEKEDGNFDEKAKEAIKAQSQQEEEPYKLDKSKALEDELSDDELKELIKKYLV